MHAKYPILDESGLEIETVEVIRPCYQRTYESLKIESAGARTQDLRLKRPQVPAQVLCLQ
jgi:hypothetical protein